MNFNNKYNLPKFLNKNIQSLLKDKNSNTDKLVYSSQDPYYNDIGKFIRNSSCWINNVSNISCFSPAQLGYSSWRVHAGTLVTSKHIILATHYLPPIVSGGTPIIFVDKNNNVIRRKLISIISDPDSDLSVGLLDNDIPSNIKIAKVLPPDIEQYMFLEKIYCIGLDQEEKAILKIFDRFDGNLSIILDPPTSDPYYSFSETIVAGDSANPIFFIINNELVLINVWTYNIGGISMVHMRYNQINNIIETLSPNEGYRLTPININNFKHLIYAKNNSGSAMNTGNNSINLVSISSSNLTANNPIINNNHINSILNDGTFAHNNLKPIAKRITTDLAGIENNTLVSGASRSELYQPIHKFSSDNTSLVATAIRNNNYNFYNNTFDNNYPINQKTSFSTDLSQYFTPRFYIGVSKVYTLDNDARNYLQQVEEADNAKLEIKVYKSINNFILSCKNTGVWESIKSACILCGARTLDGALIPLKGNAPTNYNFTNNDYSRKDGLKGNAIDKYIDTNRSNSADSQNNNHNSIWVSETTRIGSTGNALLTSNIGLGGNQINIGIGGNLTVRSRSQGISMNTLRPGFVGHARNTESKFNLLYNNINDINITYTQVLRQSSQPTEYNLSLFRSTNSNTNYSNARIAWYSIGSYIDLKVLNNLLSILMNSFKNL